MTRRTLLQKLWLAPAALLAGCAVRGRPAIDPRIYHDGHTHVTKPISLAEYDEQWLKWYRHAQNYRMGEGKLCRYSRPR